MDFDLELILWEIKEAFKLFIRSSVLENIFAIYAFSITITINWSIQFFRDKFIENFQNRIVNWKWIAFAWELNYIKLLLTIDKN